MTGATLFRQRSAAELAALATAPSERDTMEIARAAIERVRVDGERALDELSIQFEEREAHAPLFLTRDALQRGAEALAARDRDRLERIAARIERFARAQRETLTDMQLSVEGGRAGHVVTPVAAAGCYAPGGRYPLPSSVLMTAITARAAGVGSVWVASPRPTPITVAAAGIAGADGLLVAGGAHAIAGLALGAGLMPASNVVVGPGNRYVTEAKRLLFGQVSIDMLAGPSELTVLADDTANPAVIAADLLAQAEHDTDACPVLITTSGGIARSVIDELAKQIESLPTAAVARAALGRGGFTVVEDLSAGITLCNTLAPEHLEVMVEDLDTARTRLNSYGAIFFGGASAEVFGDYGIGPNHVLPTGGTAHSFAGLSVLTFLRAHTWVEMEPVTACREWCDDVIWLARTEGLEGHARAAEVRMPGGP